MSKQKHHWLVTAQMTYGFTDDEKETVFAAMQNGVLLTDEQKLPSKDLGRAQQVVQLQLHRLLGSKETTKIHDVTLINISYLGFMTAEEFTAAPAGMRIQEKKEEGADNAAPAPSASNDETQH